MQVSGKHGWNLFNGSRLLFLTAFSLLCAICQVDADPCIFRKGTPVPLCTTNQPVTVELGQPARLQCSGSWAVGEVPSTDLEILINNKSAEPNQVNIKNEYTISYSLDKLPLSKFVYTCRRRLKTKSSHQKYEILRQFTVIIAEKPKKPRNFKCVASNWKNIVCTWEPIPDYIPTRFSVKSEPGGLRPGKSSSSSDCSVYQEEDTSTQKICTWTSTADPSYRQTSGKYKLILNAENALGTASFCYDFDHWAHVIPPKPVDLSVFNVTATSAPLHWTVPLSMQDFPPPLHYKISYQKTSEGSENWHTIYVTNFVHSEEIDSNLNDLEPNTVYKVRVSIKSAVATDEDMWSQFSEVTFKTPAKAPKLEPKSDIGSFEIVGNNENRDVYVYWQTKPPYLKNEDDDFPYKVIRVENDGRKSDVQPDEITKTYAKFTGIGHNSVRFDITPANYTGPNRPIATVQVPSKLEMPPKPVVFTKVAFDEGIYELSWNPSSNQDITNYTIFWCESGRDRPYQCSGNIDWVQVPGNTKMYNVTVPDPKKLYQFAIAANTREASSGMAWFSGMTIFSKDVGKVKSLMMNRVKSDEVEVTADLDYAGRIGTVKGFKMYYCLKLSSQNCNGLETNITARAGPYPTHAQGVISDLRPESTYMLTVALLSEDGEGPLSDPIYFTTLEAEVRPTTEIIYSEPTTVLPLDTIVRTAIEESFSDVKSAMQKLIEERDTIVIREMDRMDEVISKINDFQAQVSNLTLTISEFEYKFDSLSEENCKLRKELAECRAYDQSNDIAITPH